MLVHQNYCNLLVICTGTRYAHTMHRSWLNDWLMWCRIYVPMFVMVDAGLST